MVQQTPPRRCPSLTCTIASFHRIVASGVPKIVCGPWPNPSRKLMGDSYTETLPDDLYQWPHNPERFIPFQALSNSYLEYNFLGHYVYLIDGFLTTLSNSRIRSTSGSPSHATTGTGQYDRSHLITWEEVGLYNLNVYGSWRAHNIGTFYVDTNIVHFPYCPLGPPPSSGQPATTLQTRRRHD